MNYGNPYSHFRPVCMAKPGNLYQSIPGLTGRPRNFTVTGREIGIATGGGFLVPILGDMMRMPGLPAHPASENITYKEGLFWSLIDPEPNKLDPLKLGSNFPRDVK